MLAKVAERGQVTIPKSLRLKLGIQPGTVLDFSYEHSKLVARKIEQHDAVAQVSGCLQTKVATDAAIDTMRGKA